jgi:hypothetical protein
VECAVGASAAERRGFGRYRLRFAERSDDCVAAAADCIAVGVVFFFTIIFVIVIVIVIVIVSFIIFKVCSYSQTRICAVITSAVIVIRIIGIVGAASTSAVFAVSCVLDG